MKIKKFLEKAAEEDRESMITDRDIEFLASIGVDYNKKREAAKTEPDSSYYRTAPAFNYKALIISLACFIAAALTVTLILYFHFKPSKPVGYFNDNAIEADATLQELNDDLDLFGISFDDSEYELTIRKFVGETSGKDLYFTLMFTAKQGVYKSFKLDIVVNSNYRHKELQYVSEPIVAQLSNYKIKYTESIVSQGPVITVDCKGEILIGQQWVYIMSYNETTIGQSTFLDTMENLIKFK